LMKSRRFWPAEIDVRTGSAVSMGLASASPLIAV
jgi:hypothetical protein